MLKKVLLLAIIIGFISHAHAQTDTTAVKKDTIAKMVSQPVVLKDTAKVKDTLTIKAVNKIDSTVKKDTVANATPVAVKADTTTIKKDTLAKNLSKYAPNVIVDGEIIKKSPLKTLPYKQYDALMKGEDLYDMALPATLNHYPMPDDVIKYKKGLDLSPTQISKITALGKELHRKRLEMGPIIIKNEQILDSLFRTHIIDDGTLIFYANRYGLYQGELRNAILQACYATEILLSPAQVKKLGELEKHN